jgi:hypothetical protein
LPPDHIRTYLFVIRVQACGALPTLVGAKGNPASFR